MLSWACKIMLVCWNPNCLPTGQMQVASAYLCCCLADVSMVVLQLPLLVEPSLNALRQPLRLLL